MSGFITAEGLVVPIGSDFYDYTGDQRRLANSIRSVVAIANQAAGDTVASNMASDGRTVSDTNPLIAWNSALQSLMVKGTNGWISADAKYMRYAHYSNGGGFSVTGGQAWDIGPLSVVTATTFNNTFSNANPGVLSGQINITEAGIYNLWCRIQPSGDPGASQTKILLGSSTVLSEGVNYAGGSGNGGLWEYDSYAVGIYIPANSQIRCSMKTTNSITITSDLYVTKVQG